MNLQRRQRQQVFDTTLLFSSTFTSSISRWHIWTQIQLSGIRISN